MDDLSILKELSSWLEELVYNDGVSTELIDPDITTKQLKSAVKVCNQEISASPSIFGYR